MKMLLLWAVAAWVVSVTAERPCAEYCVFLSSGRRDIEFQTGCDCMYEEDGYQLDDSGIYYELVDFIPFPAYIQNPPFYIFNPITQSREINSADVNPAISERVQPRLNTRIRNTNLEANTENIQSTHNRQEKDIGSNNQRLTAPLYIDISVDSEEIERSASMSTLTTEELELIEQSLSECADLYAVLHSRESNETNDMDVNRPSQSNDYGQFSNAELRKMIQNKCSQVSYIVQRSLNEIQKTRPTLSSVTFRIDSEVEENNKGSRSNDIYNKNKHVCKSTTEKKIPLTVQNTNEESKLRNDDGNHKNTFIFYTNFNENTPETLNTLSSEVSSTIAASTSATNVKLSSDFYTTTDVATDVTREPIQKGSNVERIHTENEYPLLKETLQPMSSDTSTSTVVFENTNSKDQKMVGNRSANQIFTAANVEEKIGNRSQYQEGEVPLPKIITHEFSNNTVQSFINGTEDIPNGDFEDETRSTKIDEETGDTNEILPQYQYTRTTPAGVTSISNVEMPGTPTSDISGNLYLLFNDEQIPARFVQNVSGSVHLGIDGGTLCNSLTEKEHNSVLLSTLCNCYKSGNCTQKEGN